MSYILDALKKSELERTRSAAPSLIGAPPVPTRARTRLLIVLAIALLANAAIVGAWWLWSKKPVETQAQVEPQPAAAVAEAPPPVADAMHSATIAPPVQPASPEATPTAAAPMARPEPAPRVETRVPFNSLSSDEQRAFAGLAFSTHLFADDPSFRAVTINGRQYREGEALTNGLVLSEITEDGVVISYRGKQVELAILQDWRL